MHILLTSVGTDGDILPFAALGRELRNRGHRITLAAAESYAPLAAELGFEFAPLVSRAENDALFGHPDFWNPLKTAPLAAAWGVRFLERQYAVIRGLVTEETVLVANPAVFAASLAAEVTGAPRITLAPQPWMIRSAAAPPVLLPGLAWLRRAPRPVWNLIWRSMDAVVDGLVGPELNRLRKSLGLPARRRIFRDWFSEDLVLGMFPEWYGPPAADWPPQLRLTGFPLFDGGPDAGLSGELRTFCLAGSPPVAFTFGTGMAHPGARFRAALEACERTGSRGIFITGFPASLPRPLPPAVMQIPRAPFRALFPLCAAVVHHGGIGTVAAAMAAGVPQLICPVCFDQADNGYRVRRLGLGAMPRGGKLTGKRLAAALENLPAAGGMERRSAIQEKIDAPASLRQAADQVEDFAVNAKESGGGPPFRTPA